MNRPYFDEMGNFIDYYEILNIPYHAEKREIRSAFCNLIKRYHPDISGKNCIENRKKLDIIITCYKILINKDTSVDYKKYLYSKRCFSPDGYLYIPKNRIKYSISLRGLLKSRLLKKGIKHKDRIFNLGQDIEIFITHRENQRGAVAFVELPSRKQCPVCYGDDRFCYVCYGIGRIACTSTLEVKIPPHTANGTATDINLMRIKPEKFTSFAMKSLKIKISIFGKESNPVIIPF